MAFKVGVGEVVVSCKDKLMLQSYYPKTGYPGTRFNTRRVPGYINIRKSEHYFRVKHRVSILSVRRSGVYFRLATCGRGRRLLVYVVVLFMSDYYRF